MSLMLAGMSHRQLKDWQAYFSIVPFTQDRADIHAGIITSMIFNVSRAKGMSKSPMDYVPKWRRPNKKPDTVQSLARKVSALRIAFGKHEPDNQNDR